jgi:hypothetical protein
MAGTKEIEKIINGVHGILDIAKREGTDAWEFDGTALTIRSQALATKVQQVLSGIDEAALAKESGDLSTIEMVKLYRKASDILPAILGY